MGLISRVSSRTNRKNNNTPKKMSSELACTYAALILQDEGAPITADSISALVKAAGVQVEPFWPGLFEKALTSCNVAELITNIGSGMGSGAAPAAGGGAAAEEKAEEKKEESEEESDESMGFDLFG